MRVDMDTQAAVANTSRLNQATTQLASRGVSTLGSGFGSLATQAIAASGAQQALGVQGTFLSGSLSMVAQTVGMVNPAMLALIIAGTAATTMFLSKKKAAEDLNKVLETNADKLRAVADSNTQYATVARDLLTVLKEQQQVKIVAIQIDIELAKAGLRHAETLDYVKTAAIGLGTYMATIFAPALLLAGISIDEVTGFLKKQANVISTGQVSIELDEQRKRITELIPEWYKLLQGLQGTGAASKEAAADLLSLRSRVIELQQALAKETGGASAAQAQALYRAQKQLIEDRAAKELAAAAGNADALRLIEEAKFLQLQQLLLQYTNDYPLVLETTVEVHADAGRRIVLQTEAYRKKAREINIQAVKQEIALYGVLGGAFQRLIAGQTAMHGGFAAFMVQTGGEAIQALLKTYATLWSAEAAANIITNPAIAASKMRAAAIAGVGIGLVGAATSVAVDAITRNSEAAVGEVQASLAGTEGRSGTVGRTLVQQGPLTLNYRATMIVEGHIFDTKDIEEYWHQLNANQLRSAGVQSDELRRA